jgi:hypothetical protein
MPVGNRKISILLLACALCLVCVGGCTLAKIDGKGVLPIMLNNPPTRAQVIKHFEVSKGIMFDYTSAFDASEILAQVFEETKADAIVNVSLKVMQTPGDWCTNSCTLGLANAKHLVVSGDAVKTPNGLGFLYQPGDVLGKSSDLKTIMDQLCQMSPQDRSQYHLMRDADEYLLIHFAE